MYNSCSRASDALFWAPSVTKHILTQSHIHRVENNYKMNLEKNEWKQARIKKERKCRKKVKCGAVCVDSTCCTSGLCCWPRYSARPCPSLTVTFGASLALSIAAIPTSKSLKNFDLVLVVFLQITLNSSKVLCVLKQLHHYYVCGFVSQASSQLLILFLCNLDLRAQT